MKKFTSISLFIFFAVVVSVLTAGLVFYQNNKTTSGNNTNTVVEDNSNTIPGNNNLNPITTTTPPATSTLMSSSVAKHNTISDCWIIVTGKVYDISGYASSHPGGTRNISNYCGKESTNTYDTKGGRGGGHSTNAHQELDQFFLGNLQ